MLYHMSIINQKKHQILQCQEKTYLLHLYKNNNSTLVYVHNQLTSA